MHAQTITQTLKKKEKVKGSGIKTAQGRSRALFDRCPMQKMNEKQDKNVVSYANSSFSQPAKVCWELVKLYYQNEMNARKLLRVWRQNYRQMREEHHEVQYIKANVCWSIPPI